MKFMNVTNWITGMLCVWIGFFVILQFLPDEWFLDYQRIASQDACVGATQENVGYKETTFRVRAEGVDELFSVKTGRDVDRFEWVGTYSPSEPVSEWNFQLSEITPPGEYYYVSDIWIYFPLGFSKHLAPVSGDVFEVLEC